MSGIEMIEGAIYRSPSGFGIRNRHQPRVARCALTLGSVIEPLWGSGGKALLKPDRLHNKRLHTDATVLSINSLAVASRLRWPSEVDRGGVPEPQDVMQSEAV